MRYLGLTVVGIVLVATCAGFSSRFNKLGAMGKLPVDGKNGRRGFNPPEGGNPTAPRTLHELSEIDERRGRLEAVKHHSLHPPYLTGGADKLRFWDFGQDTVVADRYIRLTPESGGRHGYLFNTYKNDLHAWEAIFGVFVYSKRTLGADGIAFWYRDKISSEVGGVMLGATPDFAGVGVLFDTYDNDNRRDNPRVQIVYKPKTGPLAKREFKNDNDFVPDLDSTGTDENSIDDYGCSFNFRNFYDMDLIVGKLTYLSHEKTLTLTLRHSTGSDEVPCAKLKGVELPTGYHFGFTAQTGGLADNHDVGFLHVSPISTLEEDAVIDHKLKELEEMDKPHADGFHHDSEKADRQYWRDRSNEDERMKEMYDKQALEARQRNAVAEAKKADRAIQKTELEIKKRDIVTKRIKDTVETNNPYRATRPPDTKPEGFRVRTLEEHHAIHKQMKADGSNPHQLPPHVPPPTNMAPNEELEEYRRTKGESAAHHHHGGHSPDEVPENERRFWNKELPPRDANGNLQRWPETVPKKAPEAPDAPVAADPLDSSSSSDSQPQGESHAQGEVSEAEQRSAEDEARAAAEAHAAELAQLEAEHRARQEAEAADAAAQAEVERHQAHIEAEQQREQQEQQPEAAQGDASQANDNNAAPPDAQQASEEQTPPPNPQPSPPTQKPKRQASVHHDPPVEADPNSVPKASEEHVERELAHGLDFAEMQERRRKRQQARFSAVQGNQAVKPKAPHDPKAEQGPHHPAPTPRTKK